MQPIPFGGDRVEQRIARQALLDLLRSFPSTSQQALMQHVEINRPPIRTPFRLSPDVLNTHPPLCRTPKPD